MLSQISIQNFALIDKLTVEFHQGLNIITGETGAGKSILIDALRLCLGERMDAAMVREKEKPCVIEAVFEINDKKLKTNSILSEFLSDGDENIIIRREYLPEGKTKVTVNHSIANISSLKQIGAVLVDIHGQYDHQQIFEPAMHRNILDRFADLEKDKQQYSEIFRSYNEVKKRMDGISGIDNIGRQMDILRYQIDEIEKADIAKIDEEALKEEFTRLNNAENLRELSSGLLAKIEETDTSVSETLRESFGIMSSLNRIDPSTKTMHENLQRLQIECESLAAELKNYADGLNSDQSRLGELSEKIELLDAVKRKYGSSIEQIEKFLENAKRQYNDFLHAEELKSELDEKLKDILPKLEKSAEKLSLKREKAARFLKENIELQLRELGMQNTVFECRINAADFKEDGRDETEFFISPNLGEELKPLAKIVSGGEAARVMLALKRVLVEVDPIPTLIFDEIDANIGGRLGSVVGKKVKEVSSFHQVLLITHLPQIASFAQEHIKIFKQIQNGRAVMKTTILQGSDRVTELARMMSGERETDISRNHAQEMLKQSQTKR